MRRSSTPSARSRPRPQFEDGLDQRRPVGTLLARLLHGPRQLVVDDLLDTFETSGGGELLLDDMPRVFERDDARGQPTQALEALVDGRFADAEVTGRVGLGMACGEVSPEVGVGDFRLGHCWMLS